ncbi:hypothetical protein [Microbacterium paraoxydans]|uniref:hypothetical protein n=1 Tax=Microbacterium paraoxydans TaxID=199592 RepID=UPI0004687627|nr:hypothetical protein [Microbacterium paraoxydans]
MTSPDVERPRVSRFYTSVRRIPIMIGKAGNTRLPGGPYSVTQFIAGGAVLVIGWNTMSLWGSLFGSFPLVRIAALLGMAALALYLAGQLPSTRRKIHHLAADTVGAIANPSAGTLNGQSMKLRAPHRLTGTVLIAGAPFVDEPAPAAAAAPMPVPEPAATPVPVPEPAAQTAAVEEAPAAPLATPTAAIPAAPVRFASGLDRLLEQARTKEI